MGDVTTSMKAIIPRDGQFLVLKEDLGHRIAWDFPGGGVEYGETPMEALQREVYEETRLDVEVKESIGVYWFDMDLADGMVVCHTYHCVSETFDVEVSENPAEEENIIDYAWITPDDFLDNGLAEDESMRELVKAVRDSLAEDT